MTSRSARPKPVKLVVSTYNVLCDAYIKPEFFSRCRPEDLEPGVRRKRVVDKLAALTLNSDVICLQEADYALFTAAQAELAKAGFKQGRWSHKGDRKPDGCAIFVHDSIDWSYTNTVQFGNGRDVGQVAYLACGDFRFAVANAHLRFDPPGTTEVKREGLAQAHDLRSASSVHFPPTIICGDLNALPDSDTLRVFTEHGYTDCHPPDYLTNHANGKASKVDYILHSRGWQVVQLLGKPELSDDDILPSATEPSDHKPLSVVIQSLR